jgi:hypothetical protein
MLKIAGVAAIAPGAIPWVIALVIGNQQNEK